MKRQSLACLQGEGKLSRPEAPKEVPISWSLTFSFQHQALEPKGIQMRIGSVLLEGLVEGGQLVLDEWSKLLTGDVTGKRKKEKKGWIKKKIVEQRNSEDKDLGFQGEELLIRYRPSSSKVLTEMHEYLRSAYHLNFTVLVLLDSLLFQNADDPVASRAREELTSALLVLERLRTSVQVVLTGAVDAVSVRGTEPYALLSRKVIGSILEAKTGTAAVEKAMCSFALHFTNRSPAWFPRDARDMLASYTAGGKVLLGRVCFSTAGVQHSWVRSDDAGRHMHATKMESLAHLLQQLLSNAKGAPLPEVRHQTAREQPAAGEASSIQTATQNRLNREGVVNKVEQLLAEHGQDTASGLECIAESHQGTYNEAEAAQWAEKVQELQGSIQETKFDEDSQAVSMWEAVTSSQAFRRLVEEVRAVLRELQPNIFTQAAPSKKGKVLSIPGLIRFLATSGARQDIWQDWTSGGKVIRCVALVLDPGVFASAEPEECFYPVAMALAHAFTEQMFSVSVIHPKGIVKGLSAILGPASWSDASKANFFALWSSERYEPSKADCAGYK